MTSAFELPSDPATAEALVIGTGQRLFAPWDPGYLRGIFAEVAAMFAGRCHDFQPNNLKYHDFAHTLQAACCMAEIVEGYQSAPNLEPLTARQFEMGLTAVLFHDTGYLCTSSDTAGSGAKYTYTHVLRSCALAASLLPRHGCNLREIDTVLGTIRATGPSADISRLYFATPSDRLLACFMVTADYLGQMSAPEYPDKLPALYREFEESDDYLGVPAAQRVFKSEADLLARTPRFWTKVVEPKLRDDFGGVYRHLARPGPDDPNRYLEAVERNLSLIAGRAPA
jgi:hypothetical protein